jgi:hypothetical protein
VGNGVGPGEHFERLEVLGEATDDTRYRRLSQSFSGGLGGGEHDLYRIAAGAHRRVEDRHFGRGEAEAQAESGTQHVLDQPDLGANDLLRRVVDAVLIA